MRMRECFFFLKRFRLRGWFESSNTRYFRTIQIRYTHFSDSFEHQIESDNPRSDRESSASLSVRLFLIKVFDKDT